MAGKPLAGLSARHFEAIAATLREINPQPHHADGAIWQWERTVQEFCDRLEAGNSRFDPGRFLDACNGE